MVSQWPTLKTVLHILLYKCDVCKRSIPRKGVISSLLAEDVLSSASHICPIAVSMYILYS